eukprot:TRINITY_DN7235_c0_g1_i3.p1 TRINITY_DN7235_c0_g1~~TRINITY_DN7235_c0_g1_i3.p1  ORF type:complete len:260 (+),score=56.81 TRINITY_DN7235_c0_g1_i3:869-1648(+)
MNKVTPEFTLKGHKAGSGNSYGISWNHVGQGQLLSGGDDKMVCLWDINANSSKHVMDPVTIYQLGDVVEDVSWHPMHEEIFATVGDDHKFSIWDSRAPPTEPAASIEAHPAPINCISFHPFDEVFCCTGSSDGSIGLWDIRELKTKLHSFDHHKGEVFQVDWSPFKETILASSGVDRRVHVWDIWKIGLVQTPEEAEDGPPELLFVHGGHTSRVSEFSWNPNDPWMCSSVSEDNILQIWQMAEPIRMEYKGMDKMETDV